MKHRAVAFLAACAITLLASCASAPRAATLSPTVTSPLTIELFDSPAMPAARAGTPAVGASKLHLDLPAVPEAGSAGGVPSVTGGAPRGILPVPAPAILALPGTQDTAGGLDASLRGPLRPSARASFRLEAPIAPVPTAVGQPPGKAAPPASAAAKSAAAKPAAVKPAPPKSPPAKPSAPAPAAPRQAAAAPSPSPAQASTAGSTTGSSASSASPSGSTVSSGSAGSPAPYGRLREIYARQGDELQIGLDGVGFLFLGLADAEADGMSFKSKENRANRTLFTFRALKLGTYDLDFLQQDNVAGKTSRETVRVRVVSDQDFAAATASQPVTDSAGAAAASQDSGDPAFAQKLAAAGSYSAAVAELLKGYKEGNPGLNDQIAALYLRIGSYDAAEKYWSRNLQPPTDFTARAVIGLFRVSLLQNDQQALLSYLRPFLALGDPSMEEPLVQAVRMEKARAEIGIALDLAGEYARRFPDGAWRDEVDFLTAQLLEADSQFRDLARAREVYLAILTNRPESPFAGTARLRVQYIDRHFLQVR